MSLHNKIVNIGAIILLILALQRQCSPGFHYKTDVPEISEQQLRELTLIQRIAYNFLGNKQKPPEKNQVILVRDLPPTQRLMIYCKADITIPAELGWCKTSGLPFRSIDKSQFDDMFLAIVNNLEINRETSLTIPINQKIPQQTITLKLQAKTL